MNFVADFESLRYEVKVINEKINLLMAKAKVQFDEKSAAMQLARQGTSQSVTDHLDNMQMNSGSSTDYRGEMNYDAAAPPGDEDDDDDDDDELGGIR